MKLNKITMIIKSQFKPQKYGMDLYNEALNMFVNRLVRGY